MWKASVGLCCIYSDEAGSAAAAKAAAELTGSDLLEKIFNFVAAFLIISCTISSTVLLTTSCVGKLLSCPHYA